MKTCTKCKVKKPLTRFGVDKSNNDGYRYNCKECRTAKDRERYHSHPDVIKERNLKRKDWRKEYYTSDKGIEVSRRAHLKRKYNISLEEYQEMAEKQDGKCYICDKEEMNNKNKVLCVDHDHDTGNVRGLLCGLCNSGIGHFKDNINLLEKAIKYLKEYEK